MHTFAPETSRAYPRQRGMNLVELMIALTIGLIMLVALGQLFVTSRASYTMEEGLSRVQESGRFAMEFLVQDIRMAGYAGCRNPSGGAGQVQGNGAGTTCTTSMCDMVSPADESTNFGTGILAYTYTGSGGNNVSDWTPNLPSVYFANGDVKAETDVIIIQYAGPTSVHLINPLDNGNLKISDTPPLSPPIVQNDIIIVSDCKNTDIFRVTNVPNPSANEITLAHGANGNLSSHLSHSYTSDAEIYRLVSRAYYVAPTGAGTEPALMRKELVSGGTVGAAQELVEGIEDMRILYGVDTDSPSPGDGIANRYVLANQVVDLTGLGTTTWANVVSVRLGFLVRTPNNVDQPKDTNLYEVTDGVTVGPADDNRRRQVYRSTIEVRNN